MIHINKICLIVVVLLTSICDTFGQIEGSLSIGNSISKFWGPGSYQSQFKLGISGELVISRDFGETNAIMAGLGIIEQGDKFTKDNLHYSAFHTLNIQISISFLKKLVKRNKYELNTALGISLAKVIESIIEFETPNSSYSNNAKNLIKDYDLGAIFLLSNRYMVKKSVYVIYNVKLNLGLTDISTNSSISIYNLAMINQIGIALPLSNCRTKVKPF